MPGNPAAADTEPDNPVSNLPSYVCPDACTDSATKPCADQVTHPFTYRPTDLCANTCPYYKSADRFAHVFANSCPDAETNKFTHTRAQYERASPDYTTNVPAVSTAHTSARSGAHTGADVAASRIRLADRGAHCPPDSPPC